MSRRKTGKKNILYKQPHWNIYKKFFKEYGWEAALIIQHFRDLQINYFPKGFFQQYSRLHKALDISMKKLEKTIALLEEKGFLIVDRRTRSNMNFYRVDLVAYANFLMMDPLIDPMEDLIAETIECNEKSTVKTTVRVQSKRLHIKSNLLKTPANEFQEIPSV